MRYVGELKNTFLDEFAKLTKASKEKINKSTANTVIIWGNHCEPRLLGVIKHSKGIPVT